MGAYYYGQVIIMAKRKQKPKIDVKQSQMFTPSQVHDIPDKVTIPTREEKEKQDPACDIETHRKQMEEIEKAGKPRLDPSSKSCPHCGEDIELHPDGRVRCKKCWWFQSTYE